MGTQNQPIHNRNQKGKNSSTKAGPAVRNKSPFKTDEDQENHDCCIGRNRQKSNVKKAAMIAVISVTSIEKHSELAGDQTNQLQLQKQEPHEIRDAPLISKQILQNLAIQNQAQQQVNELTEKQTIPCESNPLTRKQRIEAHRRERQENGKSHILKRLISKGKMMAKISQSPTKLTDESELKPYNKLLLFEDKVMDCAVNQTKPQKQKQKLPIKTENSSLSVQSDDDFKDPTFA